MQIGIITQSLQGNYGGILQNFALQTVLRNMGHDPITIDQRGGWMPTPKKVLLVNLRTIVNNLMSKRKRLTVKQYFDLKNRALGEANRFVDTHIKRTNKKWGYNQFRRAALDLKLDAYISGSDQVWRPNYAPNIEISYLNFTSGLNVKRIAYAASFGVDKWEYTPQQTDTCKQLATKFNAISVREDSGVLLCRDYLGVKAEFVLDPTLLLEVEDYNRLISAEKKETCGQIFTYILDYSKEKRSIITSIEKNLGLKTFEVNQKEDFDFYVPTDEKLRYYPPVELWLKAFRDSRYIICDSFHGAVFSVIYNKPFIVLCNDTRGNARFSSLLKTFGLEDRLILNTDPLKTLLNPIDWSKVNKTKALLKEKSTSFLINNLQ